MDTKSLRRFRRERQTLASLSHANIARLLDGGQTDSGMPYFVMEYIEGAPINVSCNANKLTLKARLHLFRKVCAAVSSAHQNLIVHRDLKPANILVADDGEPKLLDFGIAKLLHEKQDKAQVQTLVGGNILTPEYASPEQITGAPITTMSDVYALGVILYELLTGHRPYKFETRTPRELERALTEEAPTRPSTRVLIESVGDSSFPVSQEKLSRLLRGDLDTIVMTALRKEPEHRYSSVAQLSEDIHRYLRGLPVTAQKDTLAYRASKFIHRHKVSLGAISLVILSLVVAIFGIRSQAKRARNEAIKARQVVAYLKDMLAIADPYKTGKEVTVTELIEQASLRIEEQLHGQPEIETEVRSILGAAFQNLGQYDKAELHIRRVLQLSREIFGDNHAAVATRLGDYALLRHYQGTFTEADSAYLQSIKIYKSLGATQTVEYADVIGNYGQSLMDQAEYQQSAEHLRQALAINENIFGASSKQVALATNNLATALDWLGRPADAEQLYRKSLKVSRDIYGEDHIDIARMLNNLAWTVLTRGDTLEAKSLWANSLALRRKLLGEEHPDVALGWHNLANVNYLQRNYDEAEVQERRALQLWQKNFPTNHPNTASALYSLGEIVCAQKRFDEAEQRLEESLAIYKAIYGAEHQLVQKAQAALEKCKAAHKMRNRKPIAAALQ